MSINHSPHDEAHLARLAAMLAFRREAERLFALGPRSVTAAHLRTLAMRLKRWQRAVEEEDE